LLDVEDMGRREGRVVEHMVDWPANWVRLDDRISQKPGEINGDRDSFRRKVISAER
jgi:hypothetical protein